MSLDNLSGDVVRVKAARIVEAGAGTYNFDVFIPAGALILDILVHNEVLWAAATSAALTVGDFASAAGTQAAGTAGGPVIGAAIDADGFWASTSLKATDLLAGESLSMDSTQTRGAVPGAYVTAGTSTHIAERLSLVDRFVRFQVVSVGAGTAGRTYCAVVFAQPATKDVGIAS